MSSSDIMQELDSIHGNALEVLETLADGLSVLPPLGERLGKREWDAIFFQLDAAEMLHNLAVNSLTKAVRRIPSGSQREHAKATQLHALLEKVDGLMTALRKHVRGEG